MASSTNERKWDNFLYVTFPPYLSMTHLLDAIHINVDKWVPSGWSVKALYVHKGIRDVVMSREFEYQQNMANTMF